MQPVGLLPCSQERLIQFTVFNPNTLRSILILSSRRPSGPFSLGVATKAPMPYASYQ
jgi:hypothetical protein